MNNILEGLNGAQKAAVTSSAPVLQVLAPPGSGKTKTLTSRVAYLLSHEQYAPWNVICCTFTIKASREMRERLRGMIGEELESKLILGTFHSVCRRYLVTYGHLIGIPKTFGVADSDDSLNIIKRTVKRLKLNIDPRVARSKISHRKARGKRLEDILKTKQKAADMQEFATVFQEYEDALALSNLLDYDDLLMRCVDLLKQHPECVSNVESLLIDEFQDTNVVQFELMKLLASAKRRVTIVGDPDQSIYGFRSAEIENLRRMKAFYPETVVINLEENYRSASAVLKLAQEVIEQDNDRPSKKLKSTHCYGTLPVLRKLPNPHEEALWIVSEIKRAVAMTGSLIHYGDIAILLRSAFLSLLIEKALANAGIPYRMVGGRRFFDRVEVRIVLDYLRAISHPDNTSALLAIINTPSRKIGDTTVKELMKLVEQKKESLWSVSQKVLRGEISIEKRLTKPAEQGLTELISIIKSARKKMESIKPEDAPGSLIQHVIKSLNYRDFLKRQYSDDHQERWENVQELVTQATDPNLQFNPVDDELPAIEGLLQEKAQGAHEVLARFLANVVLSTEVESNEQGEEKPRITISTIHSAKGLEWPVVFVPAVYEGSIPHSRAEDTNEERRLLYVAMTRAKALLYMTFPVMQSREENESILSQFLPSNTTPHVSQIGPVFNDRVIEDIASILRRPAPSQEAIAKGHTSVKENESQLDDIWPPDGSHRRSFKPTNSDPVSFVLQRGQSLSDALKATTSYNQRSEYSTLANSHQFPPQVATTMTNTSAFSTSNMTMGFTTAGHHHRTVPQPSTQTNKKPALIKSASEGMDPLPKKPRLNQSSSVQGTIATFFTSSNFQTSLGSSNTHARPEVEQRESKHTLATALNPASSQNTIPPELSSHRLSCGTSLLNKRPRTVLSETNSSDLNQSGERVHTSLSSLSSYHQAEASKSSNTDVKAIMPESSVTGNVQSTSAWTRPAMATPASEVASSRDNSFKSCQLSRPGSLKTLSSLSSTGIQQPATMRKTLGVRRSMNGWESRKNK